METSAIARAINHLMKSMENAKYLYAQRSQYKQLRAYKTVEILLTFLFCFVCVQNL